MAQIRPFPKKLEEIPPCKYFERKEIGGALLWKNVCRREGWLGRKVTTFGVVKTWSLLSSCLLTFLKLFSKVSFLLNSSNTTSLIRTLKGRSKVSILERCPYYRGHEYDVTLKAPLTIINGNNMSIN